MPVPGFFFGSFSDKRAPSTLSSEQVRQVEGKEARKGSMVTIAMAAGTPRAPSTIGPAVLMRGTLQKRTTGAVSARWVARTVVIEGEPSHMLCYYDAAEKGKPKVVLRLSELSSRRKERSPLYLCGCSPCYTQCCSPHCIRLQPLLHRMQPPLHTVAASITYGCSICYSGVAASVAQENSDCVFFVSTPLRAYEFKASSAAEASDWVACVSAAAARASSEWQAHHPL